jgi:hypothetical protein
MAEVENTNLVIHAVGHWAPTDVACIESFSYSPKDSERDSKLVLVGLLQPRILCRNGWPSTDTPMHRVTIEFLGVRGFHIEDVGECGLQVMGFDIVDIAARGWEGIRFEVEDYEEGRIGFYCATARIADVTALHHGRRP